MRCRVPESNDSCRFFLRLSLSCLSFVDRCLHNRLFPLSLSISLFLLLSSRKRARLFRSPLSFSLPTSPSKDDLLCFTIAAGSNFIYRSWRATTQRSQETSVSRHQDYDLVILNPSGSPAMRTQLRWTLQLHHLSLSASCTLTQRLLSSSSPYSLLSSHKQHPLSHFFFRMARQSLLKHRRLFCRPLLSHLQYLLLLRRPPRVSHHQTLHLYLQCLLRPKAKH